MNVEQDHLSRIEIGEEPTKLEEGFPDAQLFAVRVADNQFEEATNFASLWATKDTARIKYNNIFWELMEASIRATINRKPRLSPTIFEQLSRYVEFKENFHCVSIRRARTSSKNGMIFHTWQWMMQS